jgi:hypothetical protein
VHHLAATATHHAATHSHYLGGLVILAVLAAAAWLLLAALRPITACRRCRGLGKIPARTGRGWRPCTRCGHTGYRIRPGYHLTTRARDIHRNGTRDHRR